MPKCSCVYTETLVSSTALWTLIYLGWLVLTRITVHTLRSLGASTSHCWLEICTGWRSTKRLSSSKTLVRALSAPEWLLHALHNWICSSGPCVCTLHLQWTQKLYQHRYMIFSLNTSKLVKLVLYMCFNILVNIKTSA